MRWWSGANLVSSTGTWMQLTVQNLLVLQVTGSPAATGLSLAVQAGPGLLLGVVGGAVVDRWPRKVVVTTSQVLLGVIALSTAVLVQADALSLAVLLGLSALTGVVATVDGPASALLGNDLVPTDDVPSAIGLGSVIHNVGRLAGVGVAGGAVAFAGPGAAYAANGLSFLAVAAVVPFLRSHPSSASVAPRSAPRAAGGGGLEGVRYVAGRPRLVALLAVTAVSAVLGRNYTLTLTVLVTGALAGTAQDFSTVAVVLAAGGILGAFLAGRLRRPTVRTVAVLAAVGAGLQVVAGLSPTLAVLLVVVGPMAVVESVSDTAGATVLQTDPAPAMRGRVLGVWRAASTAWGLAGPPLLGLLMEVVGVRAALAGGGLAVVAVVTAGALRHRRVEARRPADATSHVLAA
jgi:MFS family permease